MFCFCTNTCTHIYAPPLLFHPHLPRYHWDISMALAMLYVCFVIPIQVTFGSTRPGSWLGLDLLLSLIFVLDIVVNLNTGILC